MKKWVFVLGLVLSFNAYAQNSGSCAPTDENGFEIGSCHWTLDGGNLTISGEGPIRGYDQSIMIKVSSTVIRMRHGA